ncbi:hypothetical protein [Bowmanella dokdonensis]|uniref:VCBS repeat-containing protein n=1 Tax=Bowmanella dokdonensis TaxID=751969 RepID=A0A939DK32_9ALTE|nr:hypothetical protein [Bowmanella dokdonensis]MBN7824194.1 hypothetical protein [Bowmanella dokdonensis]
MQMSVNQAQFELQQQRLYYQDRQVLARAASELEPSWPTHEKREPEADSFSQADEQHLEDYRQYVKRRMIEVLAQRELDWQDFKALDAKASDSSAESAPTPERQVSLLVKETELDYQAYHLQMGLDMQTSEGQALSFQAELDWQQLNISSRTVLMSEQQLKDPLVLNFDWQAVQFKGESYFDLDGDGEKDPLPTPHGNAGYLVRDQNLNGTVDGVNELIGAVSGDAWSDIQSMDQNQDNWLDHRDAGFSQLYWWQPGAATRLASLSELKVEGLLLSGANTQATLKPDGEPVAQLRKTGAFVYRQDSTQAGTAPASEGYQMGLMQQFDFYI